MLGRRNRKVSSIAFRRRHFHLPECGKTRLNLSQCIYGPFSDNLTIVSLVCCIYHRPKRYDESSSDSSDSSDDEHGHSSHSHSHPHSHGHSHEHGQASSSSGQRQQMQSEVHTLDLPENDEPNAYEQGPVRGKGKGKRAGSAYSPPHICAHII